MKTVNDLILELQALKPSIREKPVVLNSPNGMQFEPKIKMVSDSIMDIACGNVSKVLLSFE